MVINILLIIDSFLITLGCLQITSGLGPIGNPQSPCIFLFLYNYWIQIINNENYI
jgi:hypothetical protein